MTAHDVSHIEVYVRDKNSVIRRLVREFGFVRVADSVEVDRSSVLLRRGDVSVVVTSGWATRRARGPHEDRIADIAVTCDDVGATQDAALAVGATVTRSARGHVIVSGIGDVTCTLMPADTRTGLPADGRNWVPDHRRPADRDRTAAAPVTLRFDLTVPKAHARFYNEVLHNRILNTEIPNGKPLHGKPLNSRPLSSRPLSSKPLNPASTAPDASRTAPVGDPVRTPAPDGHTLALRSASGRVSAVLVADTPHTRHSSKESR